MIPTDNHQNKNLTIYDNNSTNNISEISVKKIQEKYRNISTIQQAIQAKSNSLSEIYKLNGYAKTKFYIGLWLNDFEGIISLKNQLTASQINFINDSILDNYRNLTLADINLIFKNAKSGVYGKFYERISPVDVMTWFREYNDERMETCAGNSYNESQNFKESMAEPRNSEMTVKDFLKNISTKNSEL